MSTLMLRFLLFLFSFSFSFFPVGSVGKWGKRKNLKAEAILSVTADQLGYNPHLGLKREPSGKLFLNIKEASILTCQVLHRDKKNLRSKKFLKTCELLILLAVLLMQSLTFSAWQGA